MSVTPRLNLAHIVLILFIFFSCSCSSIEINNLTYSGYNDNIVLDSFICIGAYADGTLLLKVLFENVPRSIANFRLIHPNGTLSFINNIEVSCDPCDTYDYKSRLLYPNYILIYYPASDEYFGMLIDWTRNEVISTNSFGES